MQNQNVEVYPPYSSEWKKIAEKYQKFTEFTKSIKYQLETKETPKRRKVKQITYVQNNAWNRINQLLKTYDNLVYIARRHQIIPFATDNKKPPKHLRMPYGSRKYATQISGKFIIDKTTEHDSPIESNKLQYHLEGELGFKPAKYWKSPYPRYSYRSKPRIPLYWQIMNKPIKANKLICTNIKTK